MKKLICFLLLGTSIAHGSFEETARRYMSGPEIMLSLAEYIPMAKNVDEKCNKLQQSNHTASGSNSPASGEPVSPTVNEATVQWISACIKSILINPTNFDEKNPPDRYLGEVGFQILQEKYKPVAPLYGGFYGLWSTWTPPEQTALIQSMVKSVLGPDEVIKDFGFAKDSNEIVQKIKVITDKMQDKAVHQVAHIIFLNLVLRDEFLSY